MALTACMYPMLPIISAIVAGQGARLTRMRGLTLAFAYVQGLAFSYVLVGVAAGLTGSLLTVWLQQPAVILSAAALMVVFALAMFDVIAIQLPSAWQSRLNDASGRLGGGRLASVFAMGALSALIIGRAWRRRWRWRWAISAPAATPGWAASRCMRWPWAWARRCWWWARWAARCCARRGVDEPGQGGVWRGDAGAGGVSGRALLPGWLPLVLWAAIALGSALALWRLGGAPARGLALAAAALGLAWLGGAATGATSRCGHGPG